jgi:serine protease Do
MLALAQDADKDAALIEAHQKSLTDVMKKVEPAFVFIGGGSAVLISEDGEFLTNHHVSQGRKNWSVFLPGGKRFDAVLLGTDPVGDLSLLKIDTKGKKLAFVPIGESDSLKPGDRVFAVGNPIGIGYDDYSPTFTQGIVSVVNRAHTNYTDAVQTDAPINPGNSGGPLFDTKGRLVGINGMIQTRFQQRVNSGVGYAISTERVKLFLPRMRTAKGGVVPHASQSGIAVSHDLSIRGAKIARCSGTAKDAGLRVGDVILKIDGRRVWNHARFRGIIGMYPGDTKVEIEVERAGAKKTFEMTLDERGTRSARRRGPKPAPEADKPYLGAFLADTDDGGVLVERVIDGGPLEKAGLRPKDRIVKWQGKNVGDLDGLLARLGRKKPGATIQSDASVKGRASEPLPVIPRR